MIKHGAFDMKLTAGQWKAVLFLAGAALSTLGAFFPEYAAGLEKLAMLIGGGSLGVLVTGPGQLSVTTHPDDLK